MATYTDNYQLTLPTYAETADIATINNNMTKIDEIMHDSQISIATAYDASTTSENPYNTGDIVMYEKIAYKCKYDGVYGTWDASKWEQTTLADNLGGGDASDISYDNTTSRLTADDVQEAIDEVEGNIEDVSDGLDDAVESLAPAFDPTETYNEGDIVSKDNKLYQCNTDNTTGDWDSTKWDEYVVSEHMGEGGSTVTITPETIAEPKQKIADFEIDGASGSLYAPIVDVEGHASGAIASFPDGSANPIKSLDFSIEPIQEGSGDPSPNNNRPISGWTGAEIPRTGKNLVDISDFNVTRQHYGSYFYLNQGTYTFSVDVKNNTAISGNIFLKKRNNSNIAIINVASNMDSRENYTYTISERTEMRIVVTGSTSGYNYDFKNIQIEAGSTATDYEPYNGTTYTIPFKDSQGDPLTIYGGKVHIRRVNGVWSGEIEMTRDDFDLGEGSWNYDSGNLRFYSSIIRDKVKLPPLNYMSDIYQIGNTTSVNYSMQISATGLLYIRNTDYNTPSDFKTAMQGHHINIELATPITNTINPSDIPNILSMLGYNNLWSDTGDIEECIYQRDLNMAFNILWDAVFNQSNTRSLSTSLTKGASEPAETKEESKEEPKEEEETKEEQR